MKPLHLPLEGHDLLAVERFKDDTRHMAEFLILSTHCPLGRRGQYKRLFLTEDEYARMRSLERQGQLQIRRHAAIIEGHKLAAVENGKAVLECAGQKKELDADSIVIAVGFRPAPSMAQELAGCGAVVYEIGDGQQVSTILHAVWDGYEVGNNI